MASMLEPEFHRPVTAFRANPHPANADALLKAIDPIIDQGVRTFGGTNANPMMRSHARRLALDAVKAYDPAKAGLKTHLMTSLRGLQRYGAKQTQVISVPERVALDQHRLRGAEAELADRHGRDPSNGELADHTGLSIRRIAYVRGYRPGFSEGQLAGMGAAQDGEPWEPAVQAPDATLRHAEFLYHDLDPRDQLIMEYGLGLHGSPKLPGTKIAERLKISPGRVSQRAAAIQAQLDQLAASGIL